MRTRVRSVTIGAAVASLAAALVLTGCSSDGDDNGKDKDKGAADSGSKTPGSGGSDDAGAGDEAGAAGGGIEGSWVATTGGKPVALVVTGKRATLVGEHVCNGTADARTLKLKCADGDMDRTDGRVESVDGKTLKVAWQGFGKDEFLKTKGGKLPEGLPTAGLPQS